MPISRPSWVGEAASFASMSALAFRCSSIGSGKLSSLPECMAPKQVQAFGLPLNGGSQKVTKAQKKLRPLGELRPFCTAQNQQLETKPAKWDEMGSVHGSVSPLRRKDPGRDTKRDAVDMY